MVQIKKLLSVLFTGLDAKKFEKIASYYMKMDGKDTIGRITQSGILRMLMQNEYDRLLSDGRIQAIHTPPPMLVDIN